MVLQGCVSGTLIISTQKYVNFGTATNGRRCLPSWTNRKGSSKPSLWDYGHLTLQELWRLFHPRRKPEIVEKKTGRINDGETQLSGTYARAAWNLCSGASCMLLWQSSTMLIPADLVQLLPIEPDNDWREYWWRGGYSTTCNARLPEGYGMCNMIRTRRSTF